MFPMRPALKRDRSFYEKVWAILVERAGASAHPDDRDSFINAFLDLKYPPTEWRFCGKLGFGGKFWRNERMSAPPFYVNCYSEDRTPERDQIIEDVNVLLKDLYEQTRAT